MTNYRTLLELAVQQKFQFIDYQEALKNTDKSIIWRHDVEFSVHIAEKMAQIESKMGVKAHYFVQLHSEFYNIFEREICDLLLKIKDMGHHIGLHFDAHFWNIRTQHEMEGALTKDKILLENLLDIKIDSFSFHNTTPELLNFNDLYYADMLNVYAREIREKFSYCTDSTGIWRYERLEDVLNDENVQYLQVLTHDGMWQNEAMAPRQRVLHCINGRAKNLIQKYDKLLLELGQKNIGYEDSEK